MSEISWRRLAAVLVATMAANWLPLCACPMLAGATAFGTPAGVPSEGNDHDRTGPAGSGSCHGDVPVPCSHRSMSCSCHRIVLIDGTQVVASRPLEAAAISLPAIEDWGAQVPDRDVARALRTAEGEPRPPPTPVQRHDVLIA